MIFSENRSVLFWIMLRFFQDFVVKNCFTAKSFSHFNGKSKFLS